MSFFTPNWLSPWRSLLYSPKGLFNIIIVLVWTLSVPLVSFISFPIYILAVIFTNFLSEYGKFISSFDAWLDEDFIHSLPRSNIVTTQIIEGDITISELRSLFESRVLNAQFSMHQGELLYPELKQYLTTIMGFRIWKNDKNFKLENHIVEISHPKYKRIYKGNGTEYLLSEIHQQLLNLPYRPQSSPWEISLIRNVTKNSSILAFKTHHILADGKSLLKLFVEGLGNTELITVNLQEDKKSFFEKFMFYLLFLPNYIKIFAPAIVSVIKNHFHPWKIPSHWKDDDTKTTVAFTQKLNLQDLKIISKENGVTTSAVLMTIIAGGIRRLGGSLGEGEVAMGLPLPKPKHPEYLTNHMYMGFLNLPTNQSDILERLRICNKNFMEVKSTQQARYFELFRLLGGSQLFPFTRLLVNKITPTGFTNVAGMQEEFSVGGRKVKDYQFTFGTNRGAAGVVFGVVSYKDKLRVAVMARESILGKLEMRQLAEYIFDEHTILTGFSKEIFTAVKKEA